eukprot:7592500-Ditylum_brightwellii.AAC.1
MVEKLTEVSINGLLTQISKWHTLLTLMTSKANAHEKTITWDEVKIDLVEGINLDDKTLEKLYKKITQLKESIKVVSLAYDENGHYKDQPRAFYESKHSLRIAPPIYNHIGGGTSSGNFPKLCLQQVSIQKPQEGKMWSTSWQSPIPQR